MSPRGRRRLSAPLRASITDAARGAGGCWDPGQQASSGHASRRPYVTGGRSHASWAAQAPRRTRESIRGGGLGAGDLRGSFVGGGGHGTPSPRPRPAEAKRRTEGNSLIKTQLAPGGNPPPPSNAPSRGAMRTGFPSSRTSSRPWLSTLPASPPHPYPPRPGQTRGPVAYGLQLPAAYLPPGGKQSVRSQPLLTSGVTAHPDASPESGPDPTAHRSPYSVLTGTQARGWRQQGEDRANVRTGNTGNGARLGPGGSIAVTWTVHSALPVSEFKTVPPRLCY